MLRCEHACILLYTFICLMRVESIFNSRLSSSRLVVRPRSLYIYRKQLPIRLAAMPQQDTRMWDKMSAYVCCVVRRNAAVHQPQTGAKCAQRFDRTNPAIAECTYNVLNGVVHLQAGPCKVNELRRGFRGSRSKGRLSGSSFNYIDFDYLCYYQYIIYFFKIVNNMGIYFQIYLIDIK